MKSTFHLSAPVGDAAITTTGPASEHLIRRAQNGSGDSVWNAIHLRYANRILAYAERRIGVKLRGRYDAADAVQEAWLRVYRSMDRFTYERKDCFYRWLCRQVDRVVADRARRERLPAADGEARTKDSPPPEPRVPHDGPSTTVKNRESIRQLVDALDDPRMPDIYRRPLVMHYLECRDKTEVAQALNYKVDTIRKQLQRGAERWRRILGDDPLKHL